MEIDPVEPIIRTVKFKPFFLPPAPTNWLAFDDDRLDLQAIYEATKDLVSDNPTKDRYEHQTNIGNLGMQQLAVDTQRAGEILPSNALYVDRAPLNID
jgi:hypothetical protein